jgi:hypothetical protein
MRNKLIDNSLCQVRQVKVLRSPLWLKFKLKRYLLGEREFDVNSRRSSARQSSMPSPEAFISNQAATMAATADTIALAIAALAAWVASCLLIR